MNLLPIFRSFLVSLCLLNLAACGGGGGGDSATGGSGGKQYTLTYSAGTGGSISGTTPQTVSHGSNGTAVTAVPDNGYVFVKWSDDSTNNPRTDLNVRENLSVSAAFQVGVMPPENVSAIPDNGQITVNWSDVGSADRYNLYYASEAGITPANYASLNDGTQISGVSSGDVITGLTNGVRYYLLLTAEFNGVESAASETVTATPLAPENPWQLQLHQGELAVEVKGPTLADVKWPTEPGGVDIRKDL